MYLYIDGYSVANNPAIQLNENFNGILFKARIGFMMKGYDIIRDTIISEKYGR